MLVVDASVIAPAVADGGPDDVGFRQRLHGEQLAAPDLLGVEVLSVIRRQVHVGTIDTQAENATSDLLDLPMGVYPTAPLLLRSRQLRDGLTAHDACYVELAETLRCGLLTFDDRLARAPGTRCPIEVI